jgi:hypothetical protein
MAIVFSFWFECGRLRRSGAVPVYSGMRTIVVTATSSPGWVGVEKFQAIFTP